MQKRLNGKTSIVTGGGRGIGAAVALRFAQEGSKVCIVDTNIIDGEQIANQIIQSGGQAIYQQCDISKESEVKSMVEQVICKFGTLDILVNNAAVFELYNINDATEDQWDRSLNVNIKGYAFCCKYATQHMKTQKNGGSVVNIASVVSFKGFPNAVPYVTTKTAILGMTRAMALDLAPFNIRVNAIAPGTIDTPALRALCENNYKISWEQFLINDQKLNMLGRIGNVEEVANAVLFVASDEASFMTAECLSIDGGHRYK